MININNKFPLGSFVYVVHDSEFKRMVTGIEVWIDGSYQYKLAGDGKEGYYNEREMEVAEKEEVYK